MLSGRSIVIIISVYDQFLKQCPHFSQIPLIKCLLINGVQWPWTMFQGHTLNLARIMLKVVVCNRYSLPMLVQFIIWILPFALFDSYILIPQIIRAFYKSWYEFLISFCHYMYIVFDITTTATGVYILVKEVTIELLVRANINS